MTEDDQNNISLRAYPILREVLEDERAAIGFTLEELLQEVNRLVDTDLHLEEAYRRFIDGDRLAIGWQDAFLIALALNIGPRDLLLSFPSAFDMGGKPYIIIYQVDPTRAKHLIWQDFLNLWNDS
jgi:hypothetical protein